MMAPTSAAVLEVESLRVVHRGRRRARAGGSESDLVAVDGVSLHVGNGEVVALIGESGSGKTSLALAVAGLGRLTEGVVRILGQDLSLLGGSTLRRRRADVQVVFQDPHGSLDPRQRVGAGLRELRRLHPERTSWVSDEELLSKVELRPEILARVAGEMSGGQAQRVVIARALLLRPKLLLADEPTSALDVSVQAQILNLLLNLKSEEGIAILLVTHDLSIVRHTVDRVYVMHRGSIVEEGETETVLTAPRNDYTKRLIDALPGKAYEPTWIE
ncbi:MAG: ABC transporter ATP-binding protein [Acidimicrobiia bacterium]